jgi:hypothetical protein
MTLTEYAHLLNQTATLENVLPGFDVAVRILDVRSYFGRVDVRVTPIAGHGDTWVDAKRIVLKAEV